MNEPEPSVLRLISFFLLMTAGIFMTGVSFLGFLGWLSDPSSQKWAALFCCIGGLGATVAIWKWRDEWLYPKVMQVETKILALPVEAQQQFWKQEILSSILLSLAFLAVFYFGKESRSLCLGVAFVWIWSARRIIKAIHQIGLLKSA